MMSLCKGPYTQGVNLLGKQLAVFENLLKSMEPCTPATDAIAAENNDFFFFAFVLNFWQLNLDQSKMMMTSQKNRNVLFFGKHEAS